MDRYIIRVELDYGFDREEAKDIAKKIKDLLKKETHEIIHIISLEERVVKWKI